MAELSAPDISSVGPTAETAAIVALALLIAVVLGGGCAWLAWLGQHGLREDLSAAEERASELSRLVAALEAQLDRVAPVGAHRVPQPELLHEEQTTDLTAYQRIGGDPWI